MAKSKKIRVMLSSRCNDMFPDESGKHLSDIRRELKKEIEAQKLLGRIIFEVWINEDAPPTDATQDSWETCLQAVRDCDVLIVMSNGNAGWAKTNGDIGICHAEYVEGLTSARGKVCLVSLANVPLAKEQTQGARDQRFQDFLKKQTPFRGSEVKTIDELKDQVFAALTEAIIILTQRGVAAAASRRFDMGPALDWSRLDFGLRKQAMEHVLLTALHAQTGARPSGETIILPLGGSDIAVIVHAIPAAFSVSAARELVGRPFLLDHKRAGLLKKGVQGPLHLIACHRSATETQATTFLGFPDATVVSGAFGVYVADDVQKIQFVFLVNCRDESQTRHALQRFLEWLEQTGEAEILAQRAKSRAKILKAIARENDNNRK